MKCPYRSCDIDLPEVVRYLPLPPDGSLLKVVQLLDPDALRQHLLTAHSRRTP